MNPSVIEEGHFEKRKDLLFQKRQKLVLEVTTPRSPQPQPQRDYEGKKTLRTFPHRKNASLTVYLKYVTAIDFHDSSLILERRACLMEESKI